MNPAKPEPVAEPDETLTIFQRIQAAQRDIARLKWEKSQKVNLGGGAGYNIIPIADILLAVRKAQAEHGITLILGRIEYDRDNREYSEGGHAVGHVDYRLVGASLEDSIEGTVTVEAKDTSDKLNNKLVTNAMRTIYRTIYSIDAGEDPEAENSPAAKATAITTDRDPEVMAQTIDKAYNDGLCRTVIGTMRQSHGDDATKWPITTLRQVYAAVLDRRRGA